jgi:uncharacterized protein
MRTESERSQKLVALRRTLRELKPVLVALSGGVDSSFLLQVAFEEMGGEVVALTTRSPTAAEDDEKQAVELASRLGVPHLLIDANELEIPGYAENPTNRCYLCKGSLYQICHSEAERLGIESIVDGVNFDDLGDYRPGLLAAAEQKIRHPLAEVGLSKGDIRVLSHELGLATWDKPSSPCLSSRFPYGTTITPQGLAKVSRAERALHDLGFRECRVRYHDPIARIEVPADDLARLVQPEVRRVVLATLRELGFLYVTLDLQGYRIGSLNEAIGGRAAIPPSGDPPQS